MSAERTPEPGPSPRLFMDLHERTMQIKLTAEDAGFSLREAAWNLEERLLWRGSDAARSRASRFANRMGNLAIRAFVRTRLAVRTLFNGPLRRLSRSVTVPAQRLIETKL